MQKFKHQHFFFFGKDNIMAKEITITDEKFLEVSTRITQEITPSPIEYLKIGIVLSAIAAELFGGEDEEEKEFINLFEKDVDDVRYSIFTGGDVCKEDFVLMKEKISAKNVVYTRRFKTFSDAMKALKAEIS